MTSELHHLAAAYALDALADDERRAFEAHLPTCALCRSEVGEFSATAAVLAEGVWAEPPAGLRSQVMGEVSRTRQLPPLVAAEGASRRRPPAVRRMPALVAAALLVVVAGAAALLQSDLFGGGGGVDDLLAAPDAVTSELAGERGLLRVVWSAERDEVAVIGEGLEAPGAGRTYQLWFVLDEGSVAPAAVFSPEEGEVSEILEVEVPEVGRGVAGWGVTIEPAGGSPQPTGEILYSAEI